MNIIKKEKKEISWIGFPSDATQDDSMYLNEKKNIERRIQQKRKKLQELLYRQIAIKQLIERNSKAETETDCLFLPFVLINAPKDCRINCEMLDDRSSYLFDFDQPYVINEDIEVLRLMNLHRCHKDKLVDLISTDLVCYMDNEDVSPQVSPEKMKSDYLPALSDFHSSVSHSPIFFNQ